MTSTTVRIRRAIAATGVGLTMFGGGFLLGGIPAAHADAPSYTCSSTTGGTFGSVPPGEKHVLFKEGFTCTKNT
jgi:hypothetical protein